MVEEMQFQVSFLQIFVKFLTLSWKMYFTGWFISHLEKPENVMSEYY